MEHFCFCLVKPLPFLASCLLPARVGQCGEHGSRSFGKSLSNSSMRSSTGVTAEEVVQRVRLECRKAKEGNDDMTWGPKGPKNMPSDPSAARSKGHFMS